ncbi:uncharacterized protein LOC110466283 isoform X2 [Mizuhopecten yessoensis]|uniref:Tyrosinase-like protein n=2 Tax=Mizuhopecten yessoensis TaxID=6573 RepID=A0A210PPR4_MIZYE|nr:uncharacterized protein LOC110466283 isoform X2 [Mizuhopecten yessoensis]OWF38462.1 Tyrosinase-like protein [Mizuhopecten yessoensis]
MDNVKPLRWLTFNLLIWHVASSIDNIDIPLRLIECFSEWAKRENLTNIAGQSVLHTCMSGYLWETGMERWSPDIDPDISKYISEDVAERINRLRETRSTDATTASPYRNLRVRKEYRMLTDKERRKYHRAVKALKQDKRLKPNTFDAIANYHNAKVQNSAHGGPNFLGWHRIYLMMYEDALRRMDPDVTIPYWDCRLDEAMNNPAKSTLFSARFAGTGVGEVDKGPFKDWNHASFGKLKRDTNNGGELMSYDDVENILSRNYTSEITIPTAELKYNLEVLHGNIHSFVSGHLGELTSAAHDPLFYMLHAFIDYIWWMFRKKQEANGIDPSEDYPETTIKKHHPDQTMNGFSMYKNIDGYSSNWTRDIYTYDMSPTCSKNKSSHCNSKWLICDHDTGRCVSKARRRNYRSLAQRFGAFMSSTPETCQTEDTVEDGCFKLDTTIQNTFVVDGSADSSKWVYLPIKIINERKMAEIFRSFGVENGEANETLDIYDSKQYDELKRNEDDGKMGTYRKCQLSGSGATKIFVNVYGLNYYGFSTEYTIVDERIALSAGYTYVPVRKPTDKPSEAFISAYDSCGRLCKPYCREDGMYKPCTAAIRMGNYSNGQYGNTFADALLNTWSFDGDGVPEVNAANVYLAFYCNRKETWPWQQYNK